jgi:ketosteroid isomerase-like protein
MNASQERFAPPALTGDDLAAEEIKAVIDAYAKSIDDADIKLASEIWSTSEEASFIHPRGHERGWEQVKRNFYEVTMGAWFSERKLKVHNVVIRMYRDTAWAEFYWDFVAKFRKDGSPLTTQGRGDPGLPKGQPEMAHRARSLL